jgi:putative tryptophan/tyrosine transport system substrate-binding protein
MRLTHRLAVVLALSLILAPLAAEAQQTGKAPRIGVLAPGRPTPGSLQMQVFDAFRQGLRELGYIEGETIILEARWDESRLERIDALVLDLVQRNVDVILAGTTPMSVAAKQATSTIPIVMAATGGDPVALGLVASLGHPGRNVTGMTLQTYELPGKRLELLREAIPHINSVALFSDSRLPGSAEVKDQKAAAQSLGIRLQILEVRGPEDFDGAFHAAVQGRAQAITLVQSAVYAQHRASLAERALKNGLPSISGETGYAKAGGFMNYGPNIADSWRRAASYVDKILKGAKPADLPVEQPTKFELVINLKAAKALKLTIPQTLLLRADQVIE